MLLAGGRAPAGARLRAEFGATLPRRTTISEAQRRRGGAGARPAQPHGDPRRRSRRRRRGVADAPARPPPPAADGDLRRGARARERRGASAADRARKVAPSPSHSVRGSRRLAFRSQRLAFAPPRNRSGAVAETAAARTARLDGMALQGSLPSRAACSVALSVIDELHGCDHASALRAAAADRRGVHGQPAGHVVRVHRAVDRRVRAHAQRARGRRAAHRRTGPARVLVPALVARVEASSAARRAERSVSVRGARDAPRWRRS